jgi:hypothetical protein
MSYERIPALSRPDANITTVMRRRETGDAGRRRPQSAGTDLALIRINDVAEVAKEQIDRELAELRRQRAEMTELLKDDKLTRLQRERSRLEGLLMSVPRDKEIAAARIEDLNEILEGKTEDNVRRAADDAIAEADALPGQIRDAELALRRLREKKKAADENATRFATIRNRFDRAMYDLQRHTRLLHELESEYPLETLEAMRTELDSVSTQLNELLDIQGKVESLDVAVRAGARSQDIIRHMVSDRKRSIESCARAREEMEKAVKAFEAMDKEREKRECSLENRLQELTTQIENINQHRKMTPEQKQEAKAKINDGRMRILRDIENIGPVIENKKERLEGDMRNAEYTLEMRVKNLNELESRLLYRVYQPSRY